MTNYLLALAELLLVPIATSFHHARRTVLTRPCTYFSILVITCIACAKQSPTDNGHFVLAGESIESLQQKMTDGIYTAVTITQLYVDRIHALNEQGPALRAVIEINPDALSIAIERDIERVNGNIRGPLHGIPVLIKDNFETADRMQTTAGSLALIGNRAKEDAFVIHLLREQGAIILGKTNMTEWSNFRSVHAISGWSSRGGQTKNPYVLTSTPCGSSSGSAVAVAADFCVVAIGTSTNGSIACPSSFNGVVGIRPTIGLVSRSGTIPISKTQDTPGPIGRTVRDAAIVLGAISGVDARDAATSRSEGKIISDYTPYLHLNGLRGKVIGIEKNMMAEHHGMGALLQDAIAEMKRHGAIIVEVEFMDKYNELIKAENDLLKYEFKDGINRYLANAQSEVRSLDDLIRFNRKYAATVMPYFQQDLMEAAISLGDLTSPEYIEAKNLLATMNVYLDALMSMHGMDAIAGIGFGAYSPPAVSGWPSITLPVGNINEVPVGITFFARPYDEPGLLSIAYAFEQATQKLMVPAYLPTMKSS